MSPEELKQHRKKHRLTQKALAARLDVSYRTVVAWENTQNPIPKWVESRLREDSRPRLNPQLNYETFLKAQEKAESQGMTLEQWIAELIKNAVVIGFLFGACFLLLR